MLRAFLFVIILFFAAAPVYAGVVINEVAWMGTSVSWQDEWIELYSDTDQILDGWSLATVDGDTNIKLKNFISAGGHYLIERTNDDTVPGITADLISSFGSGGLENGGEILILKDASGNGIDKVDGSSGWAIGGNNETKETLQKTASGWTTALGTPKASNGYEASVVAPAPSPTPTPQLTASPTPTTLPTPAPPTEPTPSPAGVTSLAPTPSQSVFQAPESTPTPLPISSPIPTLTPDAAPIVQPVSPLYIQPTGVGAKDEATAETKKTSSKKQTTKKKEANDGAVIVNPDVDITNLASAQLPTSNFSRLFHGEYLWLVIGLGVGILFGAAFLFAKRYLA